MIQIRRSIPSDITTIVDFQLAMALETEQIHLDRSTVERGVAYLFSRPEKGWYWMAEDDSSKQILGCCFTLREWSDWRNGSVIWLHSVYIVPEARRVGVFKTMYHHLKSFVEQHDKLRGIRLYVDKTNARAISTYNNMGMNGEHYQLFEWMKVF